MPHPRLDPFPRLHVRPPSGWVNDPNGIAYIDGTWHVFYQHNPDAPVHGNICWGHATSTDLLTWTDEPIALRPRSETIDAGGVWSGVATMADDEPVLVYTAMPGDPAEAGAALARRRRDGTWQQSDQFAAPPAPGLREMRDPFLVSVDGRRYALLGGGRTDGTPVVLIYDATDLEHWELLGDLLTGPDLTPDLRTLAHAQIWECPQLVRLPSADEEGHTWALIVSLWHDEPGVPQLDGVTVLLGELDLTGTHPRFLPEAGHRLDDGPDFYAPQAVAHEGRVLLWGWTWESRSDRTEAEVEEAGWAGALTFPRELFLARTADRPQLHSAPAPELTGLRRRPLTVTRNGTFAVSAWEITTAEAGEVHVRLVGPDGIREVWSAAAATSATVLVDGSVLEAFVDGRASTVRAYPRPGEAWQVEASCAATGGELGPPTP